MRRVFALLLILEALSTAVRVTSRLTILPIYPPITIAFMAARLGVAFMQFAGGWTLMAARPAGAPLARWTYVASAVLTVFELGLGFAPTNIFPTYRWPAVALYCGYAALGFWVFRWRSER